LALDRGVRTALPALVLAALPPLTPAEVARYEFELLASDQPAVRVRLRVRGTASGVSHVVVQPHWGGVQECQRFIHGLGASSRGQRLVLSGIDDRPHAWRVKHAPGAELEFTYELRAEDSDPLTTPGNCYRPVVRADLFHLIGETGLILPEWMDENTPHDFRLAWSGFEERGWKTVTSLGDVQAGKTVRIAPAQFRHSLFMAGHIRIYDRDIKGRKLRVAVFGDDWDFADDELVELVQRIVTVERDLFDDHSDPYYLVTLIPTGRRDPHSRSLGGTALDNCFALFVQPGPTLEAGSDDAAALARLLAHEYFHRWNGERLRMADPEELVYWFSEGFTDYYAARLLLKAKIIDDKRWVDWLNETLTAYWTSRARMLPNEAIVGQFWGQSDIQKLPYRRGEIVAALTDWEIRHRSGSERSLDHLLRAMVAAARRNPARLTTPMILKQIERWTSADFAARVGRIVIDGELPEFPAAFHSRALKVQMVDRHVYDLGFDLEASMAKREITGVREHSAAHRAGLRDGQKTAGYSIHHGRTDRPVRITVEDASGARDIEFLPLGEAVATPQFELIGSLGF